MKTFIIIGIVLVVLFIIVEVWVRSVIDPWLKETDSDNL